jgi:tetratricopeptide (TPR) repeat protein
VFAHPTRHGLLWHALAEALAGNRAEARAAYEKLQTIDASLAAIGLADLAVADGDTAASQTLLEKALAEARTKKDAEAEAMTLGLIAETRMQRDDRAGALRFADAALRGKPTDGTLYSIARTYLAAHRIDKAQAVAARLARGWSYPQMCGKVVEAEAQRLQGKPRDAIATLGQAMRLRDAWPVHFGLAMAHRDLGEEDEARRELESCVARRGEGSIELMDSLPTTRQLTRVTSYMTRAK